MLSRGQKFFWGIAGTLAVLAIGGPLLLAAPVMTGAVDPGLITVRVHEKTEGLHIYVPVPAALVNVGLRVAVAAGALEEMEPLPPEAEKWIPVARAAVEALVDAPDAVLVEVETREEHVRVAKEGSRLVVEVRSPEADVDVVVPARLTLAVLDVLEDAGRI